MQAGQRRLFRNKGATSNVARVTPTFPFPLVPSETFQGSRGPLAGFPRETFTRPGREKERPTGQKLSAAIVVNNYLYLTRSLSLSFLRTIAEAAHYSLAACLSIRSCLSRSWLKILGENACFSNGFLSRTIWSVLALISSIFAGKVRNRTTVIFNPFVSSPLYYCRITISSQDVF